MKFRSDIQILRGISVLFVVLFHFGFQFIQSGFLGVDVFFVISGFLMAVLYDDKSKMQFYERRAKRLLPPYFVVIGVTLVSSFIINTPNETRQVVSQALFGSVFSSNIGFWLQNTYFSKEEFNPLLHLWSLGVEIQFYLIIPILAWFFTKSRSLLPIFLLGSLSLCLVIVEVSPKTSFFMMPLRVWEFLMGYGAALFLSRRGEVRFGRLSWLGLTGLALLFSIPFFKVDGNALSAVYGHPGLAALLVSIATSLVLIFGLPKIIESCAPGRWLAVLGKYSYSIYLVHFPIIVLYLSSPFSGTVLTPSSYVDFIVLAALIVILSIFLHRYVETQRFNINIYRLSAISIASIVLLTFLLSATQNALISPEEAKVHNAFMDRSTYRCGMPFRIMNPKAVSCELTDIEGAVEKRLMLVGNSHADSIKTAFAEIAQENETSLRFIVQNDPLTSGNLSPKEIIREARINDISGIILHYSPTAKVNPEAIRTLVKLAEIEDIDVLYIEPVPTWEAHIPKIMYHSIHGRGERLSQLKQDYMEDNSDLFRSLDEISGSNFSRMAVVDYFCKPECSYQSSEGVPFYYDGGHLTLTGSYVMNELFTDVVRRFECR